MYQFMRAVEAGTVKSFRFQVFQPQPDDSFHTRAKRKHTSVSTRKPDGLGQVLFFTPDLSVPRFCHFVQHHGCPRLRCIVEYIVFTFLCAY